MSTEDKTVEAVAKAISAALVRQVRAENIELVAGDDMSLERALARAAIEAHDAAKGEVRIPLVDQEAFREALFETWTNATPTGAVATLEQAWSMVEAVLDNADLTPDPSESERDELGAAWEAFRWGPEYQMPGRSADLKAVFEAGHRAATSRPATVDASQVERLVRWFERDEQFVRGALRHAGIEATS